MQTHKVWPDGLANTLPTNAATNGSPESVSSIHPSNIVDSNPIVAETLPIESLIRDLRESKFIQVFMLFVVFGSEGSAELSSMIRFPTKLHALSELFPI